MIYEAPRKVSSEAPAAWLRPLHRRHLSRRQILLYGRTRIAPTYATLFYFRHQLSLFAAAFLAITTPPHLEVSDCGAIQQIVRRIRGWSRSRFYSPWHGCSRRCQPPVQPWFNRPNTAFDRPNTTRNAVSQLSRIGTCLVLKEEDLS